jgi:hypothetical protein
MTARLKAFICGTYSDLNAGMGRGPMPMVNFT